MIESADYMLLEKIKQYQPVSGDKLINNHSYKIDGTDSRINTLKANAYIDFEFIEQDFGYGNKGLAHTDNYIITDLGMKALQDYKISNKQKKKELWLQSCWIPIIVSVLTNLLLKILPYILMLLKLIIKQLAK